MNALTSPHTDRRYVVTGSTGGIGGALRDLLTASGAEVIGVDLLDAEVTADLATPDGRRSLVADVRRLSGGRIDGVAAVAGVGALDPVTVRLNYFGTLATLDGLGPLLTASDAPRVTVVSSLASIVPTDRRVVAACLAGNETRAVAAAERVIAKGRGRIVYGSTKLALNRWLRRHAVGRDWAGAGIPLNAVAPGVVDTAAAHEMVLGDPDERRATVAIMPQPLGFPGPVDGVASALAWQLGRDNTFMTGQVAFVDGGADAVLRQDGPVRPTWRDTVRLTRRYLAARRQGRSAPADA
ncbi:short-chain dehydrogenase/reductase SDR [Beutenbergia cavernae DSM 12333]|uniref:Short-chain dehydrogenase/reductase SDR n=1 Tax=Beutenbergia cavernae (strain ATCC BAA-8 / DSM 12333 / CCUG 43141 / JCM 11478 / NBRC 16432 / NCIMB 13614 / HKI 0122) TaxID=471853 RepID=C5C103_BEUC1|nr:SDR family oxidoreductase [Beutenbergia cavernae]ACQ79407.1 short-chain dehydrogenase/reductase SDR [Beutenbergia cavernae DSM 12333]